MNEPSCNEHNRRAIGCLGIAGIGCLAAFIAAITPIILLIIFGIVVAANIKTTVKIEHPNQIEVVDVSGIIMLNSGSGFLDSSIADVEYICQQLDEIAADDNVKAVILRLNTPGGEVVATDILYQKIQELRENDIPVIACMEVMAASGGYYVAAGCDRIFANRYTTTGSIGVLMAGIKYYDLLNKIGVQEENFASGANKTMLSGGAPTTPEAAEIARSIVEQTYQGFVEVVAKGRNIPENEIKNSSIGDGRIFTGEQALELNLVDELGSLNDAIQYAAQTAGIEDDYEVNFRSEDIDWTAMLRRLSGQAANTGEVKVSLPGASAGQAMLEHQGKLFYLMP